MKLTTTVILFMRKSKESCIRMGFKYIIRINVSQYKFDTVDQALAWALDKGYNFGETEYYKLENTGIVTLTGRHVVDGSK